MHAGGIALLVVDGGVAAAFMQLFLAIAARSESGSTRSVARRYTMNVAGVVCTVVDYWRSGVDAHDQAVVVKVFSRKTRSSRACAPTASEQLGSRSTTNRNRAGQRPLAPISPCLARAVPTTRRLEWRQSTSRVVIVRRGAHARVHSQPPRRRHRPAPDIVEAAV